MKMKGLTKVVKSRAIKVDKKITEYFPTKTKFPGRFRWFGHEERMAVDRIPHNALDARVVGNRNKGRPSLRWVDNITEDIESIKESNGLDTGQGPGPPEFFGNTRDSHDPQFPLGIP